MNVTQERLKEVLNYNEETGVFTWKERHDSDFKTPRGRNIFKSMYAGKEAGSTWRNNSNMTYITIRVDEKLYLAHRLAWLYKTGSFPEHNIDHIDGDGKNNSICNLRDVPQGENLKNLRKNVLNKTGLMGVIWERHAKKYRVRIGLKSNRKHLGYFDDFFNACCARKSAEFRYGYHENHGKSINVNHNEILEKY